MSEKHATSSRRMSLTDICMALERLAPKRLAQDWDNVGLLVGDRSANVRRALLCIDLTPDVVQEAIDRGVQLVVAYHPPIFKPINRLTVPSHGTDETVFRCIAAGIGIYSTHTALDAADRGTNDRIAQICGITDTQPLEFTGGKADGDCKVVVLVPASELDTVAGAMFAAGAGWIGDYEKCSFRIPGTGTFRGGASTHPTAGEAGRFETVDEVRLEAVTRRDDLPAVIEALRRAHSYEEPAFDIYPLSAVPERGIGRCGALPAPTPLAALARKLKNLIAAADTQIVGDAERSVSRAVICVGAAGSLPFTLELAESDVIITGEMRHHDALTVLRRGCSAITLGHWASEHPVLELFATNLTMLLPKLEIVISEVDHDPFSPI